MSSFNSWKALFPPDETRAAISWLVELWGRVTSAAPEEFSYTRREPDLTLQLLLYLHEQEGQSRLLGFWDGESIAPKRQRSGKISTTKKDLCYQSNLCGSRLSLVFEFKKVDENNLHIYRGTNGMRRFVDGDYAIKQPLALMVGLTKPNDTTSENKLRKSLGKRAVQKPLQMVPDSSGDYIVDPSRVEATICRFDTAHARPNGKSPPGGSIALAHIFLSCPI